LEKPLRNIDKIFGEEAGGRKKAKKVLILMLSSPLDDSVRTAVADLPGK